MAANKGDSPDNTNKAPATAHTEATGLQYDNASMKHPVFNKMDYGPSSPGSAKLPGPRLNELTIDVPNVHELDAPMKEGVWHKPKQMPVSIPNYQKIASEGTEFIATNGNINLQVKHALDEALQSDKSMNTGHQHVDKLLAYMNENLWGSNYSVLRDRNKFLLLDSRDNPHPKRDAGGNVVSALKFTEGWDMEKKAYFDPNKKQK